MLQEAREKLPEVVPSRDDLLDQREGRRRILRFHDVRRAEVDLFVDDVEHPDHLRRVDGLAAERDDLVEDALRIPHRAVASPGDDRERIIVDSDPLLVRYEAELRPDLIRSDPVKIEALAAGEDGQRDLVD